LNDFKSKFSSLTCRIGCNVCEAYCPNHIPVNTIMRYNYYFTSKGQEKHAMEKYRDLSGNKPDVCSNCEAFCERACPYGVLTKPLLAIAHHNLIFESGVLT
jgi:ferredoxin